MTTCFGGDWFGTRSTSSTHLLSIQCARRAREVLADRAHLEVGSVVPKASHHALAVQRAREDFERLSSRSADVARPSIDRLSAAMNALLDLQREQPARCSTFSKIVAWIFGRLALCSADLAFDAGRSNSLETTSLAHGIAVIVTDCGQVEHQSTPAHCVAFPYEDKTALCGHCPFGYESALFFQP